MLPRVAPGEVRRALPAAAPDEPEPLDDVLRRLRAVIEPDVTHWNHPGFFAYFAITGSGPGILAEFLAAGAERQQRCCGAPRRPPPSSRKSRWTGSPADRTAGRSTASSTTPPRSPACSRSPPPATAAPSRARARPLRPPRRAAAARLLPGSGALVDRQGGDPPRGRPRVVRRIESDDEFRMRPDALARAIADDRAAGWLPMAVVATVGTTSTTSIDPVERIAEICQREAIWLHVDAAYAGVAAMVPGLEWILRGAASADSLVVNPHKWLFTPVDSQRPLLPAHGCRARRLRPGRPSTCGPRTQPPCAT